MGGESASWGRGAELEGHPGRGVDWRAPATMGETPDLGALVSDT